jgi:hypothetical protein
MSIAVSAYSTLSRLTVLGRIYVEDPIRVPVALTVNVFEIAISQVAMGRRRDERRGEISYNESPYKERR